MADFVGRNAYEVPPADTIGGIKVDADSAQQFLVEANRPVHLLRVVRYRQSQRLRVG